MLKFKPWAIVCQPLLWKVQIFEVIVTNLKAFADSPTHPPRQGSVCHLEKQEGRL